MSHALKLTSLGLADAQAEESRAPASSPRDESALPDILHTLRDRRERPKEQVTLVVERGKIVPHDALAPRSIALAGYCQGPLVDPDRARFSFDLHANCVRHVTKGTCAQVLDAILLGLDPAGFTVHVNDINGDTALAVWLIQHPERATDPRVRSLVQSVADADALGPAYPVLSPALTQLFFSIAMAPELDARRAKTYATADLSQLLDACLERIGLFIDQATLPEPHEDARRYETLRAGDGWVFVSSDDFVFDHLYHDGITRGVQCQQQADGSFSYIVGKKSDFVSDFPIGPESSPGTILYTLTLREHEKLIRLRGRYEDGEGNWSGSTSIGKAPRNRDGSRSYLTPEEVFDVVEEVVRTSKEKRG